MLRCVFFATILAVVSATALGIAEVGSIVPTEGPTTGGTLVTIGGSGFDTEGDVTVTFGGSEATEVVVATDTEIACVTPAHDAGTVHVTVSQTDGSDTIEGAYTYTYVAPDLVLTVGNVTAAAGEAIEDTCGPATYLWVFMRCVIPNSHRAHLI